MNLILKRSVISMYLSLRLTAFKIGVLTIHKGSASLE